MRKADLSGFTVEQLVSRFVEIGEAQYTALKWSEIRKYNRLYRDMERVDAELKSRGVAARRALMSLYGHPNMEVRLKAAIYTIAVAPREARAALDAIYAFNWAPQSGEAGSIIRGLDDGSFNPD
jgi:hypothetical protein